MASAFSHVAIALALFKAAPAKTIDGRALGLGAFCTVMPDLDVAGFFIGIHYGDLWGHRGMTHSLFFAAVAGALFTAVFYRRRTGREKGFLFLYFFACTASHGILDALTNGGLGVAFFSPFDRTRYFFGFRPIAVSPIGIDRFFSAWGGRVILSELIWIWLPCLAVTAAVQAAKRGGPQRKSMEAS
jgi:inner membrane protein